MPSGTMVSVLALWGVLGWGAVAVSALPIDYFALGDSVASGYGLADAVTGLVPPDLARPVRLHVNDPILAPRETLTLTLTILTESNPMVVDLYVALQLPDQRVWFLRADGSFSPEMQPYVGQWPVAPFRAELFHYTFAGLELPGTYRWLAVFTEPGTWTMVGAMAQAPLTFTP